ERQRGPHEQLHLADAAGEKAGERQRDGVTYRKGSDHPGALVRTHAKVAGDGRQRHVGDGSVQHLHERGQRQADRREDQVGWTEMAAHKMSPASDVSSWPFSPLLHRAVIPAKAGMTAMQERSIKRKE